MNSLFYLFIRGSPPISVNRNHRPQFSSSTQLPPRPSASGPGWPTLGSSRASAGSPSLGQRRWPARPNVGVEGSSAGALCTWTSLRTRASRKPPCREGSIGGGATSTTSASCAIARNASKRTTSGVTEGAGTTMMTTAAAIATGVGEILQGDGERRCGGVCRAPAAATPDLPGRTRGGSVIARPTTVGAMLRAPSLFWSS
jgi:hypothetical protein